MIPSISNKQVIWLNLQMQPPLFPCSISSGYTFFLCLSCSTFTPMSGPLHLLFPSWDALTPVLPIAEFSGFSSQSAIISSERLFL